MECHELERLSGFFRRLMTEHVRTMAVLNNRMGIVPQGLFPKIQRTAEETRLQSERARVNLEIHLVTHGCGQFNKPDKTSDSFEA
jgi:hypothetical protein